ncbi:tetratricopeptide repeat protein [Gemmobacter serpentinus]|uniref:tetratricopeptide repeat protein n=1 Tax=Gemmobacter serpentinus TaxID=2652247 RepID=UPI00124DABC6|nr:tetratricopeptide repeat protein [Gemmobacter serpentinus]
MKVPSLPHKFAVAAFAVLVSLAVAAGGAQAGPKEDAAKLDELFAALKTANEVDAAVIESDIWRIWSRSGSPAMDLLLERGEKAVEQGDYEVALDHLTALTDHAPDFAEGWNQRAVAYFNMGRFGQAVADIQRTLRLNPRHFGALVGFATILEAMERPKQALEVYRAALAIHPHLGGIDDAVKRLEAKVAGQGI